MSRVGEIRYHGRMPRLNDKQRAGLTVSAAAMALVLLLHCPIHGYETEISMRNPYPFTPSKQCQEIEDIHAAKASEDEKFIKRNCSRIASEAMYYKHELRLSQWRSHAAMAEWLAPLGHLLSTEAALLALGACLTWILRTRKPAA